MGFDLYMMEDPKTHWRGLGGVVDAMIEADVLDTESEPPPLGAEWPPVGMAEAVADDLFQRLVEGEAPTSSDKEADVQAVQAFQVIYRKWTQSRSPHPDKVPAYKFEGNEGMQVLPEECTLIATALDRLLANPPDDLAERCGWDDDLESLIDLIEDWRDYNQDAALQGGYEVC